MAPVYVAASPPARRGHRGQPSLRAAARRPRFFRGRPRNPRRYEADWLVIDRERSFLRPALPVVYADDSYLLYQL
jgi:hypothetical protein